MKKFLSIFLAVLFILGATTVIVSAATIGIDEDKIYYTDLLDFKKETNELWSQYNEETGRWECKIPLNDYQQPQDDNWIPTAPLLNPDALGFSAHTWTWIEDGEALRFQSTDAGTHPGMSFVLDDAHDQIFPIGSETASTPKAEYVKIRVKNHSTATQMTFGFITSNTNSGKFVSATISDMKEAEDEEGNVKPYVSSGEWETYIFSMAMINQNTNYNDLLYDPTSEDPEKSKPRNRWGASLYEFVIFPFGYDVTTGTGNYPGATMDIDYIVIGSKEYVTNYKSALEIKEANVQSIEILKAPDKTEYRVGEVLDLTGLQVKATYKDGTDEILSSANTSVSTFEEKVEKITLSFGTATAELPVTVHTITGIEVLEQPENNLFEVSELSSGFASASTGYKFRVNYSNGSTNDTIANNMFKYEGDFTKLGEQTINVYYMGYSTNFDINIVQIQDVELYALDTLFRYNEKFTTQTVAGKIGVNFIMTDGSKLPASEVKTEFDYAVSLPSETPTDTTSVYLKAPGGNDIKVKIYNSDLALSFEKVVTVQLETPVEIKVTKDPDKMNYKVGETFDITGMELSFIYADGEAIVIDATDYEASANFDEEGTARVTIRSNTPGLSDFFNEMRASHTVTVEDENGDSSETTASSTRKPTTGKNNKDSMPGFVVPVIIVVVVVAIGGVVAAILVIMKKKKK